MKVRAIDSSGDFVFGKGLNSYATQQNAIMQNIQNKILEWKGDCFFNQNAGIDWLNRLSVDQQDQLDAELQALIIKCYGVVALNSLSVTVVNRQFIANYSVQTVYSNSAQATINLTS